MAWHKAPTAHTRGAMPRALVKFSIHALDIGMASRPQRGNAGAGTPPWLLRKPQPVVQVIDFIKENACPKIVRMPAGPRRTSPQAVLQAAYSQSYPQNLCVLSYKEACRRWGDGARR